MGHFPVVGPIGKCGCVLFKMDGITWECMCNVPEEPTHFIYNHIYKNHCWNCGSDINSQHCVKSVTPGMGYHCNTCGKDLTEWKQKQRNQGKSKEEYAIL